MCDGVQVASDRINDGYCDCTDGSDEPRTSACSRYVAAASFLCEDEDEYSRTIWSSRVGDSVCDCCSGSDEIQGNCPDTCAEERKAAERARNALKFQQIQGGLKRKAMVCAAKRGEKESKIRQAEARDGLEELEAAYEKAAAQADSFRSRANQSKTKVAQNRLYKAIGLDTLSASQLRELVVELARDFKADPERLKALVQKATGNTSSTAVSNNVEEEFTNEAVAKEEEEKAAVEDLAVEVDIDATVGDIESSADLETNEFEEHADDAEDFTAEDDIYGYGAEHSFSDDDDDIIDDEEEIPDHVFGDEIDDDDDVMREEYDDSYYDHEEVPVSEELLVSHYMPADEEVSLWPWLRYWLRGAEKTKRKLEKQLEKRRQALAIDGAVDTSRYGDDGAAWLLRDTCVSKKFQSYMYEICLFKKATQDSTSLGNFRRALMDEKKRIVGIEFDQGAYCYNGPARSLKVSFHCSADSTELIDLQEPETCRYLADVATPLACFDNEDDASDCEDDTETLDNDALLADVTGSKKTTTKKASSTSLDKVKDRQKKKDRLAKKKIKKPFYLSKLVASVWEFLTVDDYEDDDYYDDDDDDDTEEEEIGEEAKKAGDLFIPPNLGMM